jgi:amidase
MTPLHDLDAAQAVRLLADGAITARELVAACLARIAAEDPAIGAFEHLAPERALAEAARIDAISPRPPLGGLPVAVKDVIDTADLPTECGFRGHAGRRPARDAPCVALLRRAGAVVLGKTVTTELAFYAPGKTRNPHDLACTPGGSSSGSAAAVAARMAPAALGTQTAGSIIRPASFCGVVGFKPTFGLLPMDGISPLAPSLDTLGFLVGRVSGARVLLEAMTGPGTRREATGRAPRIALCRTEQWPRADPSTQRIVEGAAARLERAGAAIEERELGPELAGLAAAQRAIMAAEAARVLGPLVARDPGAASAVLRELVAEGERVEPAREREARERAARCRLQLGARCAGVDALLTPSAIGEAPRGLASTGDPAFNRIWTLLGTPCLSLPAARGPAGMPVGIQLVGLPGADAALLDVGEWVERAIVASG